MRINTLNLRNFRNHSKAEFDLDSDLILITGPNGSGKTNILEAIHLLTVGKSGRARYDRDLINYDQNFCTIRGTTLVDQDNYDLEMQIVKSDSFENASTKKVKVNKVPKAQKYFCGVFNSVLFIPEDIHLITGAPSDRRRYLDMLLSQADNEYKGALDLYTKSLKQRNKLLEMINELDKGWEQLDYWTAHVLKNGQVIQTKRERFFDEISPQLLKTGQLLNNPDTETALKYKKNLLSPERIESHQAKEIAAKTTLIGPHRDDFEVFLNGHNSAEFASRGQQRSIILALKLCEIDYIESKKGERPVLLLDDIFSEFDDAHKKAVIETIGKQQTIVTSSDILTIDQKMTSRVIELTK
jgi:DNA replication and repair protein RecF